MIANKNIFSTTTPVPPGCSTRSSQCLGTGRHSLPAFTTKWPSLFHHVYSARKWPPLSHSVYVQQNGSHSLATCGPKEKDSFLRVGDRLCRGPVRPLILRRQRENLPVSRLQRGRSALVGPSLPKQDFFLGNHLSWEQNGTPTQCLGVSNVKNREMLLIDTSFALRKPPGVEIGSNERWITIIRR